jgi:F0F1-type ATP synthase epsilon subunit
VKVDLVDAFQETAKTTKNITAENGGKVIKVAIKGGVMELQNNKIIVLAE